MYDHQALILKFVFLRLCNIKHPKLLSGRNLYWGILSEKIAPKIRIVQLITERCAPQYYIDMFSDCCESDNKWCAIHLKITLIIDLRLHIPKVHGQQSYRFRADGIQPSHLHLQVWNTVLQLGWCVRWQRLSLYSVDHRRSSWIPQQSCILTAGYLQRWWVQAYSTSHLFPNQNHNWPKLSFFELIFLKLNIGARNSIDSGTHNRLSSVTSQGISKEEAHTIDIDVASM